LDARRPLDGWYRGEFRRQDERFRGALLDALEMA